MITPTIIFIGVILLSALAVWFLMPRDCEHEWTNPIRLTVGEWHEFNQVVPQFPNEKNLVYRREVIFSLRCSKCGTHCKQTGYDTKPHESDKMVADLKAHGVDENWQPEIAPWESLK